MVTTGNYWMLFRPNMVTNNIQYRNIRITPVIGKGPGVVQPFGVIALRSLRDHAVPGPDAARFVEDSYNTGP
jgi:hypothetical protein